MAQKPKASVKPDNPAEYQRFLATAKEVEADKSVEMFEATMDRILSSRGAPNKP